MSSALLRQQRAPEERRLKVEHVPGFENGRAVRQVVLEHSTRSFAGLKLCAVTERDATKRQRRDVDCSDVDVVAGRRREQRRQVAGERGHGARRLWQDALPRRPQSDPSRGVVPPPPGRPRRARDCCGRDERRWRPRPEIDPRLPAPALDACLASCIDGARVAA